MGARRPGQPAQQRPPGASRNEAFENIFGRPAVNHHLGQTSAAPSPQSFHQPQHQSPQYNYSGYAPQVAPGAAYLSPAQPSLPPVQAYAPVPPRTASHSYQAAQPNYPPRSPLPFETASSSSHSNGQARYPSSGYPTNGSTLVSRTLAFARNYG